MSRSFLQGLIHKKMKFNDKTPFVSVIVPARNEEKNIEKCIISLLALNYKAKEIIIINDGSTDRTGEILRKYEEKIRVIATEGIGPSKCRNIAVGKARGEYIAFTDADCVVERNWIEELLEGFVSEDVCGVGGIQLSPSDESSFGRHISNFFETFGFMSNYIHSGMKISAVEHNPTCNVIYRKTVFESVGNFREDMWPCEDLEFDMRMRKVGLTLLNNPKAIAYHYRPEGFRGFVRMMYRYGKAHAKLNSIHGFSQPIHYIPLTILVFLVFNVILYNTCDKTLYLLDLIILTIVVSFIFFKNRNLRSKGMVVILFLISLVVWSAGFFAGSGDEFWKKI